MYKKIQRCMRVLTVFTFCAICVARNSEAVNALSAEDLMEKTKILALIDRVVIASKNTPFDSDTEAANFLQLEFYDKYRHLPNLEPIRERIVTSGIDTLDKGRNGRIQFGVPNRPDIFWRFLLSGIPSICIERVDIRNMYGTRHDFLPSYPHDHQGYGTDIYLYKTSEWVSNISFSYRTKSALITTPQCLDTFGVTVIPNTGH